MDYQQAVDYILSFTNWEQASAQAYAARKFDLRRMRSFLARLGDPHMGRRTVHIAGSKGKGSMAAMIASVLRAAGYRVGLYTSPHLHSFCERIAFGGAPIPEPDFAHLTEAMMPCVVQENEEGRYGRLTTFELLTALAFMRFRALDAQWQVLEVGLGGRLDATNVVDDKDVCVIGAIGLEHMDILGDTPGLIAAEKAAIIRPHSRVVMGIQPYGEARQVIEQAACKSGCVLVDVADSYSWQRTAWDLRGQSFHLARSGSERRLRIPLLGRHQIENAAVAVAAIDALNENGAGISEDAICEGLLKTEWPGRLEVLGREPWLVVDGAHTPESVERIMQAIEDHFPFRRACFIVGVSEDKNIESMAALLRPLAGQVYATRSSHQRAAPPGRVAEAFRHCGAAVQVTAGVEEALQLAAGLAEKDDLICVLGSLFLVAEARACLMGVAATVR